MAVLTKPLEDELVEIDKDKVRTQDEEAEPAPMDQVEERVEAEMREIKERAKRSVAEGLRDQDEAEADKA